jgi:hypothetical protein
MQTRKVVWLGILSLLMGSMQSRAQQAPGDAKSAADKAIKTPETELPETKLTAILEQDKNPLPPHILQLRLTVENRGKKVVRLLRLRAGWLEYNAGSLYNWRIQIDGPNGAYRFPRYTGLMLPLTENDLIDLAPGESFSTPIVLDGANLYRNEVALPLYDTPGAYTVSVSGGTPDFPLDIKANVLLKNLQSNILKFNVE